MFNVALNAGHYLGNPKGCPKSLDANMTREWVLNNRQPKAATVAYIPLAVYALIVVYHIIIAMQLALLT